MRVLLPPEAAGESGQALVISVLGVFLMLAIAAYVIDVATWGTQRQKVQSAADSAALAAASCLNDGTCTSTGQAAQTAVQYSGNNGVTIQASSVTFPTTTDAAGNTTTSVQVAATQGGTSVFSKLIGITAPTLSASSTASSGGATSVAAASCTAVQQLTGTCSGLFTGPGSAGYCNGAGAPIATSPNFNPYAGQIYVNVGSVSSNLVGSVISNQFVNYNSSTVGSNVYTYYGLGWCANTGGGARVTNSARQLTSSLNYPEYWTGWTGSSSSLANMGWSDPNPFDQCTYTANSGSTSHTLATGSGGVTVTSYNGNIYINQSPGSTGVGTIPTGVYCAPGTDGNSATGGIYIDFTPQYQSSFTGHVTLLAGFVTSWAQSLTLSPAPTTSPLVMMATDSGYSAPYGIIFYGSGGCPNVSPVNVTGTIFSPRSQIYSNLNNLTMSGLWEAGQQIYINSLPCMTTSITGLGPTYTGGSSFGTSPTTLPALTK